MAQPEPALHVGDYRVSIARMSEHDLLEVVEIERMCGLSPWGWDAYHAELEHGSAGLMLVARTEGKSVETGHTLAGYVVARVAADELHINNVAIRPELRRHGIASTLLKAVLSRGGALGAASVWLEVRASNRAAQKLYERCGFHVVGRRRDYYNVPVEDALVMHLTFGPLP